MISLAQVTFHYPGIQAPALRDVTLELPEAAFVVVSGPSGAGKSTLLRCINGLVPHFSGGTLRGRIRVNGMDPVTAGPEMMCHHVGFVFQDPEAQFVMDYVEDELAFALENAGMPVAKMRERVSEVMAYLDLAPLRDRRLATLSGGEKQRVAIAAGLAFRPQILVLDEPTSQLDPQSAQEVLDALVRLRDSLGLTIVLAEHRLERVLGYADRLVALPGPAAPARVGPPAEVLPEMGLLPPVASLGKRLGWTPLPATVAEARPFAAEVVQKAQHQASTAWREDAALGLPTATEADRRPAHALLQAESLTVAYDGVTVLHDVSLSLSAGEVTVLVGRNGAGKSTLLKALVGLVAREAGEVWVEGRSTAGLSVAEICRQVAYLPQDPSALLFAETVLDELHITLRNHEMDPPEGAAAPEALLAALGLAHKAATYPRDLSVGERQRAALAAILITQPRVVLLDEPTRGLDYEAKGRLAGLIRHWRAHGRAVLLVTHDVELAAEVADRILVMDDAGIAAQGPPHTLLRSASRFTPQIARLFPDTNWLTVDDVLAAVAPAQP
ncbi:MAG: ATP-binding cassette domain-containing protein [Anaerolineae bacterium]|nr:ATP-binding cassette domain-containing protein [Anaerolineae bacterium]